MRRRGLGLVRRLVVGRRRGDCVIASVGLRRREEEKEGERTRLDKFRSISAKARYNPRESNADRVA